jgi:putative endonuclease
MSLPGLTRQSIVRPTPSVAYYVYILASGPNGTLYVGVTKDLMRRVFEHREGLADGFTKRYGVKSLAYYEAYDQVDLALQREKNLKHWSRAWKVALIERDNPQWADLWHGLSG